MAISTPGIGSGLDINSIISQLMTLERRPITLLDRQESSYKAKLSAFGTIKSALAAFQTAAQALATPAKFASFKATVADATVLGAAAGPTAAAGSYSVQVQTLAQNQKLVASRSGQRHRHHRYRGGDDTNLRVRHHRRYARSGHRPLCRRGDLHSGNGRRPDGDDRRRQQHAARHPRRDQQRQHRRHRLDHQRRFRHPLPPGADVQQLGGAEQHAHRRLRKCGHCGIARARSGRDPGAFRARHGERRRPSRWTASRSPSRPTRSPTPSAASRSPCSRRTRRPAFTWPPTPPRSRRRSTPSSRPTTTSPRS